MAKTVLLAALLSIILLLPISSSLAEIQDFCVAELTLSDMPSGYPCRANVSAGDFCYRALATPGTVIKPFGVALASAFAGQFPGVNGLLISASRVDVAVAVAVGGVVPLHTHPAATEILFVTEGTMEAGFISSTSNTVYTKILNKGDVFVFPQGLLHFQYNAGKMAVALASYNSRNPGLQVTDYALFANNLPSAVVDKVTFLDDLQVKKLKALFGGSG